MSDEHWGAVYDSARAVRVQALRAFGFTERQARFLVTVMVHSGSFLERQYSRVHRHGPWAEQPGVRGPFDRPQVRDRHHVWQRAPRSDLPRAPQAAL